jgi:hypothetical protein
MEGRLAGGAFDRAETVHSADVVQAAHARRFNAGRRDAFARRAGPLS